jgi:hypothetical protein
MTEGSRQGQSAGGGTAERVGALGNRAVGSITRAATRTGARQTKETAVTATRFYRGSRGDGFNRPIPGSRTAKENDDTGRTDGRSRAGAAGGGNYGVGSDRAKGRGNGRSTGRGGDLARIGTAYCTGAGNGNNSGVHRHPDSDVESW